MSELRSTCALIAPPRSAYNGGQWKAALQQLSGTDSSLWTAVRRAIGHETVDGRYRVEARPNLTARVAQRALCDVWLVSSDVFVRRHAAIMSPNTGSGGAMARRVKANYGRGPNGPSFGSEATKWAAVDKPHSQKRSRSASRLSLGDEAS